MENESVLRKFAVPFTQVPNPLLDHTELSLQSKGLYCFMLSKPDNWRFSISRLAGLLPEGERAIMGSLKELKQFGWLAYKKNADGTGDYILLNPNCQNPNLGNSNLLKQQRISNTIVYSNKDLYKIKMSEIEVTPDGKKLKTKKFEIELSSKEIKYFEIAEHFRNLFIKNLTEKEAPIRDQKNATYKNYVDPIRLCIERDEFTFDNLRDAYEYLDSPAGEFWKTNILSTSKLREQMPKVIASKNFKRSNKTPAGARL